MSKIKRRLFPLFLIIFLFLPFCRINAAGIIITEVQTEGAGGSYDECVKIMSDSPVSLAGWKLQSRSATQDRWVSRSGEGFPELQINAGATAILASANYSGADEIWRHTSRWGLSAEGGGTRLLDQNGTIITEKYWGSLENLNQNQTEPSASPVQTEQQTAPEPQEEQQPAPGTQVPPETPQTSQSENQTLPQQFNNETIEQLDNVLLPAPASAAENPVAEINVQISEFMPDPAGSDDGEWIEIKNLWSGPANIGGWLIDDEDGGSKPFKIPENTALAPNGFVVFYKNQTNIALNNDSDSVRLLNRDGTMVQEIKYENCASGLSYAAKDSLWVWTKTPTPSTNNLIQIPAEKNVSATIKKNSVAAAGLTGLEEARKLPLGSKITVKGIVSAPPEILGSQIFYLAGSGIQVYMYKKDFPDLKLGDEIEVAGILGESLDETRIKVQNKSDIKLISRQSEPEPHGINISEIGENFEGWLVKIFGKVSEINASGFYLADENKNKAKIYYKNADNFSGVKINAEDEVEVVGIVSQTKTGYRVLPRFETDIIIKDNTAAAEQTGEAPSNPKTKYYIILGVGLCSALAAQGWKKREFLKGKFKQTFKKPEVPKPDS